MKVPTVSITNLLIQVLVDDLLCTDVIVFRLFVSGEFV